MLPTASGLYLVAVRSGPPDPDGPPEPVASDPVAACDSAGAEAASDDPELGAAVPCAAGEHAATNTTAPAAITLNRRFRI